MSINVTGKTTAGKEIPIQVDANGVVATSATLGDVTVSAVTEYAEDTAHTSGA